MNATAMSASQGTDRNGPAAVLKALVHGAFRKLPASWYWRFLARRVGYFDPELRLLRYLCDRNSSAVDVGASNGGYAVHMLQHASRCIAFEARPRAAAALARTLRARPGSRLRVEAVALSDHAGEARLRVLTADTGRSTIEDANPVEQAGAVEVLAVPMRRLDDYAGDIGPVGCIKIDVEGHEEAVLRGAAGILLRDRPALIIEVEERHKSGSVAAVNRFLGKLGYRGFFYRGGRLHAIDTFDPAVHQDAADINRRRGGEPVYVNNFLFFSGASLSKVCSLIAH